MSDISLPSSIGRMTLCGSSLQVVPKTMRRQSKPHDVRRKRKQAFQKRHVSFGWIRLNLDGGIPTSIEWIRANGFG